MHCSCVGKFAECVSAVAACGGAVDFLDTYNVGILLEDGFGSEINIAAVVHCLAVANVVRHDYRRNTIGGANRENCR